MDRYDRRVIEEFLRKAWRWEEHSEINKAALNYIAGFMLTGFTGNINLDLNAGQHSRIIYTPAPIRTLDDLDAALMKMMRKMGN